MCDTESTVHLKPSTEMYIHMCDAEFTTVHLDDKVSLFHLANIENKYLNEIESAY
jgi:hypothetical protein